MPRKDTDDVTAAEFMPPPSKRSLPQLAKAAEQCKGCDLYEDATQAVFGEGPRDARVMVVGEQPGDQEDKAGHPFVGPAGRVLDEAFEDAGIDRNEVYVTNTVKHFKWTARGKRRLHAKPNAAEIRSCLPWLEAELHLVAPEVVVPLGATASQALLGSKFRVTRERGRDITDSKWAPHVVATMHPSAVLRMPERRDRDRAFEDLVADLKVVARILRDEAAGASGNERAARNRSA